MPLKIVYIAYYAVNFMKTNPIKEIQSQCGVSLRDGGGEGCTGRRLCLITPPKR